MARPRGEIRQAIAQAAQALQCSGVAFTWREIAIATQVGFQVARQTVRDMERAGQLERCGQRKVPGICRPVNLYSMPAAAEAPSTAGVEDVLRAWRG